MNVYLNGKIISTSSTGIVFEYNNRGIFINMNTDKEMELFKFLKLFVYEYIINNYKFIYGFQTMEKRSMFMDLLRVNKIGPKIALSIIKDTTYDNFKDLINLQDINKIKNSLNVTDKQAMNIMIDLKERYNYKELDQKSNVINALKKIGYKKDQIDIALKKTKLESNNLEENVKNVIKVISLSKTNLTKNVNT